MCVAETMLGHNTFKYPYPFVPVRSGETPSVSHGNVRFGVNP